ncbi:nucleotidyl transferase AbiEii/AbiGii toxin family protein [Sphingomonas glacialis]|uniref:nucleotidyl transferase AbiEii/AbiGii toxin family protein n=1 Tax=Sphingomonas glacialis TaxID=658225 RepID=UPI001F4FB67D|nr:nucleotidyl transferase AbiEii/AbiGii toxin family protein [Sphingomonas glacialis]
MSTEIYAAQVTLLVRTIPEIVREEIFALKGGTAINLFVRDLPRLSVDMDLVYLPVAGRGESLASIRAISSISSTSTTTRALPRIFSRHSSSIWSATTGRRTSCSPRICSTWTPPIWASSAA